MHVEWVDMSEIIRREKLGIYDEAEYEKALKWIKENCKEGRDVNPTDGMFYQRTHLTPEEKEEQTTLRNEYRALFKRNLQAQLDNIEFVDKKD